MMMKIIYSALAVAAVTLLSSCNKFLDVKPLKEVTSKDLLETRKGLETALGGVYYNLSQSGLYGDRLMFRSTDALVGYWEINGPDHNLYELGKYNYSNANIESHLGGFWSQMYTAIFNANNIINTLEKRTNLTKYEKIALGEAIGLRAFLHLDIFRLYGPVVFVEGLTAKAPPYRKESNATIQPFISAESFLTYLEEDLIHAEDLLKDDPILTNGGTANGNATGDLDYNSLLDRRRNRFNVNAATALLARVYQLKGEQEKAATYAQKTLDATTASFVTLNDLGGTTTRDFRLTKEIIFGLYVRDHYDLTSTAFGIDGKSIAPSSSLYVNYDKIQSFIYTEPGDYRRVHWFQNALNYTVFLRYAKPPAASEAFLAFQPEVSLISISEMHFILAEAALKTNVEQAITHINTVRQTRGILNNLTSVDATPESVKEELIKEARRQYIGEGQLFFLLKRLYHKIDVDVNVSIPPSLEIFRLPLNKKEFDFNN